MPIRSARRFFLLQAQVEASQADPDTAGLWRSKQAEVAGTALPSTFPSHTALAAAGYTTREDLDGASADELRRQVPLPLREAEAVLAAFAALPPL